jgi:two-component system response regulator AtoC
MTHKILIIDDDAAITDTLEDHLFESGYRVQKAHDLIEGSALWTQSKPDLVILDQKLPDGDGIDLLKEKRASGDLTSVIIITGHHDMGYAVEAMKAGAFDFIHKPLDLDELDIVMHRALDQITPKRGLKGAEPEVSGNTIIGRSKAILEVHKQIGLAAKTGVFVMISGESGTGKELVARQIHAHSTPDKPFVAVNCSAIVPTLIESELFGYEKGAFTGAQQRREGKLFAAGEGTLFLDEIGDLQFDLQAKLLRVLQERSFTRVGGHTELPFRARVITATHRNLQEMTAQGKFREDLYFRLKVLEIRVPPLRNRPDDIPLIAEALLKKAVKQLHSHVTRISTADMKKLQEYHWSGNVRELENVITQSVIHSPGEVLNLVFHPEKPVIEAPEKNRLITLEELEKEHIAYVLNWCRGHLGRACQILGITRPTLRKKMNQYGITLEEDWRD